MKRHIIVMLLATVILFSGCRGEKNASADSRIKLLETQYGEGKANGVVYTRDFWFKRTPTDPNYRYLINNMLRNTMEMEKRDLTLIQVMGFTGDAEPNTEVARVLLGGLKASASKNFKTDISSYFASSDKSYPDIEHLRTDLDEGWIHNLNDTVPEEMSVDYTWTMIPNGDIVLDGMLNNESKEKEKSVKLTFSVLFEGEDKEEEVFSMDYDSISPNHSKNFSIGMKKFFEDRKKSYTDLSAYRLTITKK